MRKMQAELNFDDSSYRVNRVIEQLSTPTTDIAYMPIPRPRGGSGMKLICMECSHRFTSRNALPECPGCGGSDVEPR